MWVRSAPGRHWGKNYICELEKGHSGLMSMYKLSSHYPVMSQRQTLMAWDGWEGSAVESGFLNKSFKKFFYLISNGFFSPAQRLSSKLTANINDTLM